MSWTQPRLLAYQSEWFDLSLDNDGPACYELGTGGPRRGNLQWHYVGETSNECKRMACYGRDGSHLSRIIRWHLKEGWRLYYRAWACRSKKEAKKLQDNLLAKNEYDWNRMLNS